ISCCSRLVNGVRVHDMITAVWKNPLEFRPERFLEEDVDIKGCFRLEQEVGFVPVHNLVSILVTSMMSHLLHHFVWTPPQRTKPEEIDMSENPGLISQG
ncbi:hypothetical protein EUTSA_v10017618mg, partial [Eutrema salsugineum]